MFTTKNLLLIFSLSLSGSCLAGMSWKNQDYNNFKYDIRGAIYVKPSQAYYPIVVTTTANSYVKSLELATNTIKAIKNKINKLDKNIFSFVSSDFLKKKYSRLKSYRISFISKKNILGVQTKLVGFLVVSFTDKHLFYERAKFSAIALDFNRELKQHNKNKKHTTYATGKVFYKINNPEQYRAKIVDIVYKKAKSMAMIVGKNEKATPKIKSVYFNQSIKQNILNFNRATLSIEANIVFYYDKPKMSQCKP